MFALPQHVTIPDIPWHKLPSWPGMPSHPPPFCRVHTYFQEAFPVSSIVGEGPPSVPQGSLVLPLSLYLPYRLPTISQTVSPLDSGPHGDAQYTGSVNEHAGYVINERMSGKRQPRIGTQGAELNFPS